MLRFLAVVLFSLHLSSGEFNKVEHEVSKDEKNPLVRFTFKNGTYEIPNMWATWEDAKNECKSMGMELVSIETKEEHDAIIAAVSTMNSHFFTSGTNAGHPEYYFWEGSGQPVGYTGWAPGQPDNPTNPTCILLYYPSGHLWSDSDCSYTQLFMCESQP